MKAKRFSSVYVSISAVLLSCLGAVSVGFSSWAFSQGDTVYSSGNINADETRIDVDGISITPTCFVASHYHYENRDGGSLSYSNYGELNYAISIDVPTIKSGALADNDYLKLTFALTFESLYGEKLPLFKSNYLSSISYGGSNLTFVDNGNPSAGQYKLNDPYEVVSMFVSEDISSGTGTINKNLTYTFSQQMAARYYETMQNGTFYLNVEVD